MYIKSDQNEMIVDAKSKIKIGKLVEKRVQSDIYDFLRNSSFHNLKAG